MTAPSGGRDVLRDYGITEAVLDQWERSAAEDAESDRPWSVNPRAILACIPALRAALGPDAGAMRRALGDGAVAAPVGEPFSEDHWAGTSAGRDLIRWVGHQWHNEGTIDRETAEAIRGAVPAIERAARADAEARLGEVLELLVYSDVPQRIVDRAHDIAALAPRGGGE